MPMQFFIKKVKGISSGIQAHKILNLASSHNFLSTPYQTFHLSFKLKKLPTYFFAENSTILPKDFDRLFFCMKTFSRLWGSKSEYKTTKHLFDHYIPWPDSFYSFRQ